MGPPHSPAARCSYDIVGMCWCRRSGGCSTHWGRGPRCCPAGSSHKTLSVKPPPHPEPGGMCHPQPFFFLLTFWWCFPFFAGIFSCSLCCGSPRAGGLAHPGNALPLPDPPSSTTPKLSKGSARLCCLFVVVLLRSCEHPRPGRAGLPWGLHPPGSVQRQPRDCRGGNTNPSRSLPWIQGLRALAGTF